MVKTEWMDSEDFDKWKESVIPEAVEVLEDNQWIHDGFTEEYVRNHVQITESGTIFYDGIQFENAVTSFETWFFNENPEYQALA